uniref:Apoptosis inhibitor 5 n=1 Tax=Dendroctonus ponderosae TaxID=77166 RepID=A0AAR5P465_DENPD
MADELQEIYEKYEILSGAKDKILEHSAEYMECINIASKGGPKGKKLVAQIISQFFKHFPDLQDTALNVLLDLCEDGDSEIRICSMKVLPFLCKGSKEHIQNIASILAQLLQLDDLDYTVACNSLVQVFREDPVLSINAIFTILYQDEALREKLVTFLYKRLATIEGKNLPEVEELLVTEGKKIIQDCTSGQFMLIMPYLTQSKLGKTLHGQKELVNLVYNKIEVEGKFNLLETHTLSTDRLVLCVELILPLFNASNESTKLLIYYCTQVLPQWNNIRSLKDGEQLQLRLLRQLAIMSTYCVWNAENMTDVIENVFNTLKEYMPLPPEDVDISKVPNLDFTSVECLLYTFHKLARKNPEFLTNDSDRLKDFRLRLQYFARGVQGCKRGLENTKTKKDELSEEDQKKIQIAPAVLENINAIVKDLFYQPPLYKCNVQLSFRSARDGKKEVTTVTKSGAQKRHVPITFGSANGTDPGPKQVRNNKAGEDRKLYQPPSGKFSNNFGRTNSRGGSTRGGRGGGRNWRN